MLFLSFFLPSLLPERCNNFFCASPSSGWSAHFQPMAQHVAHTSTPPYIFVWKYPYSYQKKMYYSYLLLILYDKVHTILETESENSHQRFSFACDRDSYNISLLNFPYNFFFEQSGICMYVYPHTFTITSIHTIN